MAQRQPFIRHMSRRYLAQGLVSPRRVLRRPDHQHAGKREGEQSRAHRIGHVRVPGVEIAADRRAGDRSGLPGDRAQGDRPGQRFARHEIGRERSERRAGEGSGDPEQGGEATATERDAPVWPRGGSRRTASERDRGRAMIRRSTRSATHRSEGSEQQGTNWQGRLSRRTPPLPLPWCAGDVVDLPADDHDHRHLRHGRGEARRPVETEIADAQWMERGVGHGGRLGAAAKARNRRG